LPGVINYGRNAKRVRFVFSGVNGRRIQGSAWKKSLSKEEH